MVGQLSSTAPVRNSTRSFNVEVASYGNDSMVLSKPFRASLPGIAWRLNVIANPVLSGEIVSLEENQESRRG